MAKEKVRIATKIGYRPQANLESCLEAERKRAGQAGANTRRAPGYDKNGIGHVAHAGEQGDVLTEAGGKLSISLMPDGPLIISGNLTIFSGTGRKAWQGTNVALCRCGGSANKPFCDGSHRDNGFSAEQEFSDVRGEDISGVSGDLIITVKENAMLSIKGPVTIFSRSGNSVTTRTKAALCRCGHSLKKPFCDISHKKSGFTA